MKKLFVMVAVLMLASSFLANVHAAEDPEKPTVEPPIQAQLTLSVTFKEPEVIAIELNETSWVLQDVGLREERKNTFEYIILTDSSESQPEKPIPMPTPDNDKPTHVVSNTGNVPVGIDIGYSAYEGCGAGYEPGVNQFATMLCEDGYTNGRAIPPHGQIGFAKFLAEGEKKGIPLVYYSPTELTGDIKGMSATYELRAYPESHIY